MPVIRDFLLLIHPVSEIRDITSMVHLVTTHTAHRARPPTPKIVRSTCREN